MKLNDLQKEVILFPFMQIASGHHRVADTLEDELQRCLTAKWNCHKVDILSYRFGSLEKLVSSVYLSWIQRFPNLYHWLYNYAAYSETTSRAHLQRHYVYEALFMHSFKQLVQEKKPTILIFTHSLPSHLASVLKRKKQLNTLTINVYTDFFVNHLWGIEGIDYHFVPTLEVKNDLIEKGVPEQHIFITGIPVDREISHELPSPKKKEGISILVTGGNLGVGGMYDLLDHLLPSNRIHYHVLCGKNDELYRRILRANQSNVTPYPYISCRVKMNELYSQVDGVLTKAGGVTLSECLIKRKPIFIYQPLPGQETINVHHLNRLGLVTTIESCDSVEKMIIDFLSCQVNLVTFQEKMNEFHKYLEKRQISAIIDELTTHYLLNSSQHVQR